MNRFIVAIFLSLITVLGFGQEIQVINGLPEDLSKTTLVLLKHEAIEIGTDEENEASKKYVLHRQENHNRVSEEFNRELEDAAKEYYPYNYVLAFPSELESLLQDEAKYVLYSTVYQYDFLKGQPEEDELLIFTYYLKDHKGEQVYTIFDIDEMKIYDAKMIVKKLAREIKKSSSN